MEEESLKRTKIDEGLYSRQLYVLGHEAQRKITSSKVLIVGLGALGVEVAKNIILAGIKDVVLHDEHVVAQKDVVSNFYISQNDLGKSKASACVKKLSELNNYVSVSVNATKIDPTDKSYLEEFTAVCVADMPVYANQSWLVGLNDTCHEVGVRFMCGRIAGLFCYSFCDFGEKFLVLDKDGENPVNCLVASAVAEAQKARTVLSVTVHEESRHGLVTGDFVKFNEMVGDFAELNNKVFSIRDTGPYTFEIDLDNFPQSKYDGGGMVTQVKQPVEKYYKPLSKMFKEPGELLLTDFAKFTRPKVLHAAFQALQKYIDSHAGTLPCEAGLDQTQLETLFELFKPIYGATGEVSEVEQRKLIYALGAGSSAELAPMASFLGGVLGQEVLKACSQKFTPLKQFLYFDAVECLPYWNPNRISEDWEAFMKGLLSLKPSAEMSFAEEVVFGSAFTKQLGMLKVFLVGAGAIGCEMIKNWAQMGVACENGLITVTDMDIIERSNLNRQFLFRDRDVGSSKAHAAARAAQDMQPRIKIKPMEDKVGPETEHIFTEDFMKGLDFVTTALDNLKARLYVDARCLQFQKPLLESGTLGTKGNTQVVVPHLTENYGASRDPPEKEVAICTLKNFPYRIEHTLQWARELFESNFDVSIDTVNKFLGSANVKEILKTNQFVNMNDNVKLTSLRNVKESLTDKKPTTFADCVVWARLEFEDFFSNQIRQLLHNFPPGTVTSSGAMFWSGTKREPVPLTFNAEDNTHLEFILAAANLRAFAFNIKQERDLGTIRKYVDAVIVPEFQPKSVKIAVNDKELKEDEGNLDVSDLDEVVNSLLGEINDAVDQVQGLKDAGLKVSEFEKDDDLNFHMDFITAASNLRARNYGIEEVNKHKAKLIAGKIIPAIATTTALVTGLICLELYKLVAGKNELESYKNGFVNLALPLFAFSEPIGVVKTKVGNFEWSIWDKIEVDARENKMTLEMFVAHFEKRFSIEINMLTFGSLVLYSSFLSAEKRKERLKLDMQSVTELISKKKLDSSVKSLQFELYSTDEDDEDVDLPPIEYRIG